MAKNDFVGKWRITEMSTWDKDYFDEEVPAYIKIEKNLMGNFHLGYVQGEMDGRIIKRQDGEYFEFTFDGNDYGGGDDVSGSGWMKLKGKNNAEGEIKFHLGDGSTFQARRIKR
ncbi:MAG: hypothetical protein A2Z91_06415 [Deltaproteobacteria bacterium GWA2_38_16]|nr:MAG: hypothetical protein A2Z91_06415 [Deltaproteobacteria bacterium GWA2_38_16]